MADYTGAPQPIRATGTEPFDTAADGIEVIEHPELEAPNGWLPSSSNTTHDI